MNNGAGRGRSLIQKDLYKVSLVLLCGHSHVVTPFLLASDTKWQLVLEIVSFGAVVDLLELRKFVPS